MRFAEIESVLIANSQTPNEIRGGGFLCLLREYMDLT